MLRLPKVLEREPLVDAVFEVRLNGSQSLADILPGFLFHELDNPKPVIARLPAAEIPLPMRANDPGLQFAPVLRLDWRQYFISVGDRNVVISCKLPYPKWPNFKAAILDIVSRIAKIDLDGRVERYSVKHVNLIQAPNFAQQVKKIRMEIRLGDVQVNDDHMSLQVHRKEDDIVHILSVVTGAQGQMPDGSHLFGALVDVDSIQGVGNLSFSEFANSLEPSVRHLTDDSHLR